MEDDIVDDDVDMKDDDEDMGEKGVSSRCVAGHGLDFENGLFGYYLLPEFL